jgi:hypothetical protein
MHDIISDHSDKYIDKELSESLTKENIIKFINDNQLNLHPSVIESKDIIKRILSKLDIEDFYNLKSIYIYDKTQGYLTLSSINNQNGYILSINIGIYIYIKKLIK